MRNKRTQFNLIAGGLNSKALIGWMAKNENGEFPFPISYSMMEIGEDRETGEKIFLISLLGTFKKETVDEIVGLIKEKKLSGSPVINVDIETGRMEEEEV